LTGKTRIYALALYREWGEEGGEREYSDRTGAFPMNLSTSKLHLFYLLNTCMHESLS
jgi:hypothetical protein